MTETLLLAVFALLLALLITGLSFPLIMNILNLPVADNWLFDLVLIRSLLMITVLVSLAALKVNLQDQEGTLAQVEQLYKEQFPESLFEYAYLDETIAAFYREEEKLSQLFMIFSGMAIAIGCLGVYGLISFMTVQKTKEVGVRKVLGASLGHIVFLFTKELLVLILFAFALAAPVAWYVMNGWLQGFEYRIALGADLFFVSVGATMLITLVTVGYRSISAALVNPVDSLRSE